MSGGAAVRCPVLATATWPQVVGLGDRVLVVPVGSTEQHGPHLPLSTDTDIAVALAARVAAIRADVVVAPEVAYGASGEHQDFPGTLSIGSAVLEMLLVELCRSAAASFPRVLLLSAHGGNAEAVKAAVDRLGVEGRDVVSWSPRWPGDAHAGCTETSVLLAVAPGLVRLDRAAAGALSPLRELLPVLRRDGVRAVSSNGVLGDPAGASAAQGELLLAAAVADLGAMLDSWPAL